MGTWRSLYRGSWSINIHTHSRKLFGLMFYSWCNCPLNVPQWIFLSFKTSLIRYQGLVNSVFSLVAFTITSFNLYVTISDYFISKSLVK